jgi:hypothetical protein
MGTDAFPQVTDQSYWTDFDSISRFNEDDCDDYLSIGQCCLVDPSPGKVQCDGSRKFLCNKTGDLSPDSTMQVSCSSGVLAFASNSAGDEFVILPQE